MRNSERLRDNWLFSRHDFDNTENVDFDDSRWRKVKVPHDWGIEGGFYKGYDAQFTRIVNNFEESESLHLGRTGGLPHAGRGVYRRKIYLAPELIGKKIFRLEFDGVMSHSQIFLNGKSVGGRAYGYSSFACDITDAAVPGENVLTVKAENFEAAARWYPGGGIYRNVRLLTLDKQHFMYNGVWVRTLNIVGKRAEIAIAVETAQKVDFLQCEITSPAGEVVYSGIVEKNLLELELNGFSPWSCEKPLLYSAKIALLDEKSQLLDEVSVKFGIRAMSFSAEDGFMLNGKKMVFNGVCMHHDLGPLGAAFSLPAARRQLKILQSIGVNALRCTHNPPAPEVLDLCDELGILVIDEAFDCWKMGKVKNDYHRDFDLWHERDLVDMIKRDRNHPSVMLWSIGNEILEQGNTDGWKLAEALQNIVHATDPDRPATAGLSFEFGALTSGIAKVVDVPGFNYKPHRYEYYHNELPSKAIFGSETASTVSTRGEYYYPITEGFVDHPSIQCSSYDVEYPAWATTPDREFHFQDKNSYVMGEFVWTGFDYLGEPCPFDYQWPAHSAYFGIFDLVGLPKDRAYLYCSRWNKQRSTLHILPHWNMFDRMGLVTPVHIYTSYDRVELFLNGRSQGVKCKNGDYRICFDNVVFEPGELRVDALDESGKVVESAFRRTASDPYQIKLTLENNTIRNDGEDLAFLRVAVLDKAGNLHPTASNRIKFYPAAGLELAAVANGDPTSLETFDQNHIHLFNGQCVVYLKSKEGVKPGIYNIMAAGEHLQADQISVEII